MASRVSGGLSAVALVAMALALGAPTAGAAIPNGTITSSTGWSSVATLARNVTVSHKTIRVSGYGGTRVLTKITWVIGSPYISLTAGAVLPRLYGPVQHSFAEGKISALGSKRSVFAGINGNTFCGGCARNGQDLLHGLLIHNRRILANGSGPGVGYGPGG